MIKNDKYEYMEKNIDVSSDRIKKYIRDFKIYLEKEYMNAYKRGFVEYLFVEKSKTNTLKERDNKYLTIIKTISKILNNYLCIY